MLGLALAAVLGVPAAFAPRAHVTPVRLPAILSAPFQYRRCACGRATCVVVLCMKCGLEWHHCRCRARA